MLRRSVWILLALASCSDDGAAALAGTGTTAPVTGADDDPDDAAASSGRAPTTGVDDADPDPDTTAAPPTSDDTTTSDTTTDDGPAPLGPSQGCGTTPGDVTTGTIDVAGQTREYLLVLPAGYDDATPYPLVFAWHGLGGHSSLAQSIYQVETFFPEPVIVVYPQGLPQAGVGGENGWNLSENGEDIALFDALANAIASQLCVDLDRVYSMGYSFGAFITNHVACYRGQYIRAIAAVSGGGPFASDECQGPVAAMIVHGQVDNIVPYSQGVASRDRWQAENACGSDGRMWSAPDELPTECTDYAGCLPDAPLTWCSHVGSHTWRDWMNEALVDFLAAQQ